MNNKRIIALANLIDKDDYVIDVGCDHAYLDIYLYKNNICKNLIASDISEGALKQAKENLEKYHLTSKIPTILSNGLENINNKYDTVVIAGMGYNTIKNILLPKYLDNTKKIIIQSNNEIYNIRKLIKALDYNIIKEKVVLDRGKYYTIISAIKGTRKYTKRELLLGKYNPENADYYEFLYKKETKILKNIPKKNIILRLKKINYLNIIKEYKKNS